MHQVKAAAAITLALSLAACGGTTTSPSPRPSQPASSAAAPSVQASPSSSTPAVASARPSPSVAASANGVRIVDGIANTGMSYLAHKVALDKGFFQQQGFAVTLQTIAGNTMMPAIVSGEVAFGDASGTATRAAAQGLPLRMVNCYGIGPIYALALAKGVASVKDLEGKSVASNGVGDDIEVVGKMLVQKYGGDPSKVTWVALGASTARYAAVQSGRLAGGVLSVNEMVRAKKDGLTLVGTAADMPTSCAEGIVTSTNRITQNPAEVTRFLTALNQAITFVQSNRTEATQTLAAWQGVSLDDAQAVYDLTDVGAKFSLEKNLQLQALAGTLKQAQSLGTMRSTVTVADVSDLSLLPPS